jgi:hypothetical protein
LFDGALGTPSSGTLTNATGLPISTGVSGLGTGVATFLATPSSANLKSALTDETGSGGSAVFATGPTITGLNLAAGSTSVAPINLASGTNLTSATAGAIEYDGTCFYGTPATSNRGVIGVEHFIILTSTNTLTNNTSAQPIFDGGGGPANGAITLPVGTYLFEGFYNLSGLNGGSKNIAFGFAGTATVGSILYRWQTNDTSAFDYANVVATTSATNTISGSLSAMPFCLNGVIRITGAGTVIPQITQVTLSAAASVLVNSYISFKAIGSDTVASLGNVS